MDPQNVTHSHSEATFWPEVAVVRDDVQIEKDRQTSMRISYSISKETETAISYFTFPRIFFFNAE
jgi:hypothetical protein